jgi:hypothetical protein
MKEIYACHCDERKKSVQERNWGVVDRHCNYSAFNGYKWAYSIYSQIVCLSCNATWRTRARYVNVLRDAELDDRGRWRLKKIWPG